VTLVLSLCAFKPKRRSLIPSAKDSSKALSAECCQASHVSRPTTPARSEPHRHPGERRDPVLQAVAKALDPGVRRGDGPASSSGHVGTKIRLGGLRRSFDRLLLASSQLGAVIDGRTRGSAPTARREAPPASGRKRSQTKPRAPVSKKAACQPKARSLGWHRLREVIRSAIDLGDSILSVEQLTKIGRLPFRFVAGGSKACTCVPSAFSGGSAPCTISRSPLAATIFRRAPG